MADFGELSDKDWKCKRSDITTLVQQNERIRIRLNSKTLKKGDYTKSFWRVSYVIFCWQVSK